VGELRGRQKTKRVFKNGNKNYNEGVRGRQKKKRVFKNGNKNYNESTKY
jgi:hypothetical protein